jgi:thiamine biosynthesis lipoprotein
MLSRFIDGSDIDQLNRSQPGTPVRVRADTFRCLQTGLAMEALTNGAFNIVAGSGTLFSACEVLLLDEQSLTIARNFSETLVDLGGIGKGFAVDVMIGLLREWEVPAALVDAGGSTVFAYSKRDEPHDWSVGMEIDGRTSTIQIECFGFAASGTSVKGGHIVDGRTGKTADARVRTWALARSATEADALSTAFFVMEDSDIKTLCANNPEIGAAWCMLQDGRNIARGSGRLAGLKWNPASTDQPD